MRQPPVRSRPTGRFPWASPFAWGMQEFGLGENVWMAFLGRSSLGRPYRARLCSIAPNYSKDWFYFLSKSAKLHGPRIGIWKASKNESRFETGDAFRPRSFRSSIYRQRSPCLTGWRAGQPSSGAYRQGRLLLWRMRRLCVSAGTAGAVATITTGAIGASVRAATVEAATAGITATIAGALITAYGGLTGAAATPNGATDTNRNEIG